VGGNAAERADPGGVMLHFAYGSNMSRTVMRRHAPGAQAVGVAALANYRFLIMRHGHASVAPLRGSTVYGVLWQLTPRDRVTLAAWENVAGGLYRAATLPVREDGRRRMALVYLARSLQEAAPQAGYMEVVIAAALEWHLPKAYIDEISGWLPRHPHQRREFRWT
jgi:AIG2 family protein